MLALISGLAQADERGVFEPDIVPRVIQEDNLDSENFEVGVTVGVLSIEDFESSAFGAVQGRYHISEDLFLEFNAGIAQAGETSYERLAGEATLLDSGDRDLFLYNLSFGVNLLPGEAFVAKDWAFNTRFYLVGGLGVTDFAGDNRLTLNLGFGYQLYPTDWLAVQVSARDHIWDMDILGVDKVTHNIELSTGVSVYF